MVDLSGGPEGPIEHGFSNGVFVIPALIIISLCAKTNMLSSLLLLGLRSLFVSASPDVDDEDDGIVEDEMPKGSLPFPGGKMPSPEELLKMLDSMGGLSDEDKETLKRDLLKKVQGGGEFVDDEFGDGAQHIATSFFASQFFILMAMLAIIGLIFVFFGYKLYKSLSERERKREEKRKNKQLKKKK